MGYSYDLTTHASALVNSTVRSAKAKVLEAREKIASHGRVLSVDAQEALIRQLRQVRCINDIDAIEITISNNPFGYGVVVSELGTGTALRAGLLVGDVIMEINGYAVSTHEEALARLRQIQSAEYVFSLASKAHEVVVDKEEPGELLLTLANPKAGAGVEVRKVESGGLAAKAGLRAGDRILSANGSLVDDHLAAMTVIDSTPRWLQLVLAESQSSDPGEILLSRC